MVCRFDDHEVDAVWRKQTGRTLALAQPQSEYHAQHQRGSIATNVLAIMLHGGGSNGADFAPLANSWKASLPSAVFVSPNAPAPSSFGSGYQWFSVAGVTEDNRSARIADARRSFDQVISSIVEGNGFTDKLDRVALVGFSGRLASPLPLQPALEAHILLIHGMC
nr:phospholipase [Agrobacterium vitis]